MGTIKIGEAEKNLINQIEDFQNRYDKKFLSMLQGFEVTRMVIAKVCNKEDDENAKGIITRIESEMNFVMDAIGVLSSIIDGLHFSEELDEKKFGLSWQAYEWEKKQYYDFGYGAKNSGSEVTEKQFFYAITAWEKEVIKAAEFLRKLEQPVCNKLAHEITGKIEQIVAEYAES